MVVAVIYLARELNKKKIEALEICKVKQLTSSDDVRFGLMTSFPIPCLSSHLETDKHYVTNPLIPSSDQLHVSFSNING